MNNLKVIVRFTDGTTDMAQASHLAPFEALMWASRLAKSYSEASGVLTAAVYDGLDLITRFIDGEVEKEGCTCGCEQGNYPCEVGSAGEGCGS